MNSLDKNLTSLSLKSARTTFGQPLQLMHGLTDFQLFGGLTDGLVCASDGHFG